VPNLCVFLASGRGVDPIFVEAARALGAAIAARGWRLVYGGAHRGLMGELADAALAGGAEVIGILPHHLAGKEIAHRGLTTLELVGSMAERKGRMFELADGFLTLPGGFGTLDELFETLTAAQLGLHAKPIALVDVGGYFTPIAAWLDGATRAGLVAAAHRALLTVHADLEDALASMAVRWAGAAR
jgi:uncharacterized protein (TIGR00730 family)